MDTIVHYTSQFNWRRIRDDRFLRPRSDPHLTRIEVSDRVQSILQKQNSYVVGIPSLLHEGWREFGLWDYLLRHTTGEVALEVPIIETEGTFVREHVDQSPKRTKEKYGKDLFAALMRGEITLLDPRLQDTQKLYLESTVPLSEYNGSYLVPEIWLPKTTPVYLLRKL